MTSASVVPALSTRVSNEDWIQEFFAWFSSEIWNIRKFENLISKAIKVDELLPLLFTVV